MTERRAWGVVLALTALALAGRAALLREPMRFDEAVSWAYYVGRSWGTIVGTYQHPNNHVLYSLLAKASAAWAGYPPWALRLPALVAGVAIVPLTWAVGRRFADDTTARIAAALSVGSTPLILYAINARGYSLVVALFLVALLAADRLRAQETTGRWLTFVACGALGLYTIPIMLYPFGVAATWLALSARTLAAGARRRFLVRVGAAFAAALAVAGLLYLPILRSAGVGALLGNKFVAPSPWPVFFAEAPGNFAATLGRWASPLPWWATLIMLALALVGMRRPVRADRPSLALATLLWCSAVLLVTHRSPFVRVWLFLLPLYLLAVARGITWCASRFGGRAFVQSAATSVALACAMLALALGTHAVPRNDETGVFPEAERITAEMAPRLRPSDRVLAPIPAIGPLLYYFPRVGADTALLTVPLERADHAWLVLDRRAGQDLAWAVRQGMVDPREFPNPRLVATYPDAELWELPRAR
ncbi:MAG: hypothetical protein ABJA80_06950 [bacterium]